MDDLISRQDAINTSLEFFVEFLGGAFHENVQKELITRFQRLPSAQRKGHWVFSPDHAEGICTCCNYKIYGRPYQNTYLIVPYNFCPNCGADMRGKTDG